MIEDFEEEVKLFYSAKTNFDDFEKFITIHLPIVKTVVNRYYSLDEYDDLYQEGCIGLITAFQNFDPTKNVRFSHYCKYWIKNKIQDFAWRRSIVKTTREEFLYGLKPKRSNLEDSDLENMFMSDDTPIFRTIHVSESSKIIRELLKSLTAKERKILKMYFGLGKHVGMSYSEIGKSLGLTKQRIQQIVKKAEASLKEILEKNNISKDLFQSQ